MKQWVSSVYSWLDANRWIAALLVRISVGFMFFGSGWRKLNNLGEFTAYFASLGIPAPSVQAPFAAFTEFSCGALLMFGLGTRIAGVVLTVLMTVATITARLKEAKIGGILDFLYLNEWLLILLLVWLVFHGAGKASLDARFFATQPEKKAQPSMNPPKDTGRRAARAEAAREAVTRAPKKARKS
jgi:putative oxidoreductase